MARISFFHMRTWVSERNTAIVMYVRLPMNFIKANITTVQMIISIVSCQSIFNSVQKKTAFCDSVCDPTHCAAKVRIPSFQAHKSCNKKKTVRSEFNYKHRSPPPLHKNGWQNEKEFKRSLFPEKKKAFGNLEAYLERRVFRVVICFSLCPLYGWNKWRALSFVCHAKIAWRNVILDRFHLSFLCMYIPPFLLLHQRRIQRTVIGKCLVLFIQCSISFRCFLVNLFLTCRSTLPDIDRSLTASVCLGIKKKGGEGTVWNEIAVNKLFRKNKATLSDSTKSG